MPRRRRSSIIEVANRSGHSYLVAMDRAMKGRTAAR
jgi:hypothetical protein